MRRRRRTTTTTTTKSTSTPIIRKKRTRTRRLWLYVGCNILSCKKEYRLENTNFSKYCA